MIKYAKTKDGKIVKVSLEGDVFTSRYEIVGELRNTIEELLDLIVIDFNDDAKKPRRWILSNSKHSLDVAKEFKGSTATVYGAIWTDKGLIYVAKMNEEGKWKLI